MLVIAVANYLRITSRRESSFLPPVGLFFCSNGCVLERISVHDDTAGVCDYLERVGVVMFPPFVSGTNTLLHL